MNTMPKIALGAWSWGAGAAGGDQVFGSHLFEDDLRPVFSKALECGLKLWDTAAVYGEGTSERILGNFVKDVSREQVLLSTKFTPQIASAGTTASLDVLNKYLLNAEMPIVSSTYWNMVFGPAPELTEQDKEGLQTMRNLGRNMAWLLDCIEAGRQQGRIPPQAERDHWTNFNR